MSIIAAAGAAINSGDVLNKIANFTDSVANAATHAPGANCRVEIDDREPGHLSVLVSNDGAHAPDLGPGGGFGLVGMRERAELVGAKVHYGATEGGGWEVRLTIPRDATIGDLTEEPT